MIFLRNNINSLYRNGAGDIPLALVWLFAIIFIFWGTSAYPLLNNNEGLYAEIPREMLQANSWKTWVIPRLNGLMYMEKPPLLYWLTSLSFATFGINEFAARLVPNLSAMACVYLILSFGVKNKIINASRWAALMFVGGLGTMLMARALMFDMLLTALLTAALMEAYWYLKEGTARHHVYSMAALALALLAKGFVALILFGAVIGMYCVLSSNQFRTFFRKIFSFFRWQGLFTFLIIALPWHIAASIAEPIFPWFYFINEHILRFLGKREPFDYYGGAWWYYLPRLAIFMFPWCILLPLVFSKNQERESPRGELDKFLACAWLMPLLFFSVSSAKANYYLVIFMPFITLHVMNLLTARHFGGRAGQIYVLLALLLISLLAFFSLQKIPTTLLDAWSLGHVDGAMVWRLAWGFLALCMAWFLIRVLQFGVQSNRIWHAMTLFGLMSLFLLVPVSARMGVDISTRDAVRFFVENRASAELVLYRVFEQQSTIPFYLQRPVRIVDSRSHDLFWGGKLERNSIMVSDEEFERELNQKDIVLVVIQEELEHFKKKPYFHKFRQLKSFGPSHLFVNSR